MIWWDYAISIKKVANCKWLHTVTEPVLITPTILSTAETPEGLYASIPGFQGLQLSSEQYKAVYDYEAQVSVLARISYLCIRQMF